MSGAPIQIALAADEAYLEYAKIAVASLLLHHCDRDRIEINFLHSGLSPRSLASFQSLRKLGAFQFTPIQLRDSWFHSWPEMRWSRAAYLRLALPSIFPQCEKMIYLDSDILVLDEIAFLWQIPLEGRACAAVACKVAPEHRQRIGLAPDSGYFNSGVMIFNPAQMKRENVEEHFVRLFERHRDTIKYPDQDVLNLAYENRWLKLPQRWNLMTSTYRNPPDPALYSPEETAEALKNPGIAHFTGKHKPWLIGKTMHHPYGTVYRKYAGLAGAAPALLRRLFWKSLIHGRLATPRRRVPWKPSMLKIDA